MQGSFKEVGVMAGESKLDEAGNVEKFTPGNYILGHGKLAGRPCVVGGEDFTLAAGNPNLPILNPKP